jgi:hypothetical protein
MIFKNIRAKHGISLIFIAILFLNTIEIKAQTDSVWKKWDFLIGEWQGEGSGDPGKGKGNFSFKLDLNKRILVRNNHAEYPATKDKPAFVHDDRLIIYAEIPGKPTSAIYFDNEDHVINYKVNFSADLKSVMFVSDEIQGKPRFRLTYSQKENNKVEIKFELAPPGKPDAFSPYIQASAIRKK